MTTTLTLAMMIDADDDDGDDDEDGVTTANRPFVVDGCRLISTDDCRGTATKAGGADEDEDDDRKLVICDLTTDLLIAED